MSKAIPTTTETRLPTCQEHSWCWGSCVLPDRSSEPVEHRTHYRVLAPVEQAGEERPAYKTHVLTGMAQRGDGAPLVHLSISTARRNLEVGLTFAEIVELSANLWHAAGLLAQEMSKDDVLVRCTDCGSRWHPDALGGHGRPCRDCGGKVVEVDL